MRFLSWLLGLMPRFMVWLGAPVRALCRGLMVLVNLSGRQVQSLCTIFLIGAIVVFSWQQWFYVLLARGMARAKVPADSPAWRVLEATAGNVFWQLLGCLGCVIAIAWGARWFSLKIREAELQAGQGPKEEEGEE